MDSLWRGAKTIGGIGIFLSYSLGNLDIDLIFYFLIFFFNGFVVLLVCSLAWLEVLWGCLHCLALLAHLFVNSSTMFSPTHKM